MRLHYKTRSRFVYQLADNDFFVKELMAKYSLPDTEMSNKFSAQMVGKINEIEPLFDETPAMKDPSWKLINCKEIMFTRHSVHGFH